MLSGNKKEQNADNASVWLNLGNIMPSHRSQTQQATLYNSIYIVSRIDKSTQTESRQWVDRDWGEQIERGC